MAAGFAGPLSGSRATDHPADIRFLTDDTAVVVSEGGIIFAGSTLSRAKGLVRATWVLVRHAGGWRTPAATTAPPARPELRDLPMVERICPGHSAMDRRSFWLQA